MPASLAPEMGRARPAPAPDMPTRPMVMHASLKRDVFFPATAPALSTGRALVQICLFDASGLSIDYHMRTVRVTGR
jgi:hypothetical protein